MTNLGFYGQAFCGFCAQITANVVIAQQYKPAELYVWLIVRANLFATVSAVKATLA